MLNHDQFHDIIERVIGHDPQADAEAEKLLNGEIDCAAKAAILIATQIANQVKDLPIDDNAKGEIAVVNLFAMAFIAGYVGGRDQVLVELEEGDAAITELVEPPSDHLPGNYL